MSPYNTKHPCSHPECGKLVLKGSRCEDHKISREFAPEHHSLYNRKSWHILRANQLRQFPYCIICNTSRNLQVDHIVDHKGDPDLFYDMSNLQTLCDVHHSQKTGKEHNK